MGFLVIFLMNTNFICNTTIYIMNKLQSQLITIQHTIQETRTIKKITMIKTGRVATNRRAVFRIEKKIDAIHRRD